MALGSDNKFPKVIVVEGSAPSNADSGDQKLFIDSADHHLKRKNSSGTVVDIESGGSALTVVQGATTVTPVTEINFTAGATVTDAGSGVADVAVGGGGGLTVEASMYLNANGGSTTAIGGGVIVGGAATLTHTFVGGDYLVLMQIRYDRTSGGRDDIAFRIDTTALHVFFPAGINDAGTTAAFQYAANPVLTISAGSHTCDFFGTDAGDTNTRTWYTVSMVFIKIA